MATITERVRRIARRFQRPIHCSACHLPRGTDRRLISGPGVYICESCVAAAAVRSAASASIARCSFCGRREVPIGGSWPDLAICSRCLELSREILAEDGRRTRPAT